MAPEAKAKELIEKFSHYAYEYEIGGIEETIEYNAKQCAFICVDEIIEVLEGMEDSLLDHGILIDTDYWTEVKQHLTNHDSLK